MDNPGGQLIAQLQNDQKKENFLIFKVLDVNKNYLKVIIEKSFDSNPITGWIKKSKDVGFYARNYEPEGKLKFYSKPDFDSKVKMELHEYSPDFYQILDCKNRWANAKLNYKNKTYEGWIEPDMQCGSPYTICN